MIATDLPLTPTKPVDAGVAKFCETCKLCGELACMYNAIPLGDPSWEWENLPGSPPGYKGWRLDTAACAHCGSACQAVCPFNTVQESMVHELVKATVSTTPLFNSFFRTMAPFMGFGAKNPETWWELDNEPAFGYHPRMLMPAQSL